MHIFKGKAIRQTGFFNRVFIFFKGIFHFSLQSEEPIATSTNINDDIYYPSSKYRTTDNTVDDCPCYAGLDEQLFYNAKYEMTDDRTFTGTTIKKYIFFPPPPLPPPSSLSTHNFIPSPFPDLEETSSNSYSGSTVSTLQMKNDPHINFPPPPMHPSSAYECYNNIVLPSQSQNGQPLYDTGFSYPSSELIYESLPIDYYPAPPPPQQIYYDPYSTDPYRRPRRHSIRDSCYECLEMQNMPVYYAPCNLREQYDSIDSNAVDYQRRPHLERFGLSKKGLLQIDYSVSWSNLQRLIASKRNE